MIPIFWQTLEMYSCGIRTYVLKINSKFLLLNSSSSFSTKFQFPSFNFFFYLGFLSRTFTNREGISLFPHYHLHPLHRHLYISRAITAESSPLHIASSRIQTGNLLFPSENHYPLRYAPLNLCIVPKKLWN